MSWSFKKAVDAWHCCRISLLKESLFYGLSLNRSGNIFDVNKFITDPWAGNLKVGRAILDCSFVVDGDTEPLNILDTVTGANRKNVWYVTGFQWIRDLQAVGGNSSRKYVRHVVSAFINSYRKAGKFWLENESWDSEVVGERIVNWILLYPFFAAGANDKFQRTVLSSLAEHFSHLQKCYKAETDPYPRLIALKALIYCYCSMKTDQHRKVGRSAHEMYEIIGECIDEVGMFKGGSPADHFHIFRSLLETRFVVKNSVADTLDSKFVVMISMMAHITRFFRMCDGGISNHHGAAVHSRVSFMPDRHIIDTALSVVEIGSYADTPTGFCKLETKKSAVIINTKARTARSQFNHPSEPGINIFDLEASFGSNRVLHRSDMSVLYNGLRTRIDEGARTFTKKSTQRDVLLFEGEVQFPNRFFDFAMRREVELAISGQRLGCTDFVLSSIRMDAWIRFVFTAAVRMREINKKSILLSIGASEYMFTFVHDDTNIVTSESRTAYPTIEIGLPINAGHPIELNWSIECLK
ncbi:MAG: hypothetical protein LBD43_03035 [Holosporales bacterium]|jgi:hypothetical protein|nr:hypothetical protein [Holosporales bacterium]